MPKSSGESEAFGPRLRRERDKRGLNQAQLADRAGLQPSAVSHFESGRRAPSFENLKRLADALGVTIDYLLGRVGEPGLSGPEVEQLFRDMENMSQADRESVAAMASVLARKKKDRAGDE